MFSVYFVCIMYCTSDLWEFKGHVKFAAINAIVSNSGVLWDWKAETRGGNIIVIDFHWPVASVQVLMRPIMQIFLFQAHLSKMCF